MWPEPVERVARELRAAAVEATIQEFPDGTPTAEAAAKAIGCSLDADRQVDRVRRPDARTSSRSCRATGAPTRRASPRRPARARSGSRTREEVLDATGFEPGAVAPFPLPRVARGAASSARCSSTTGSGSAPARRRTWPRSRRASCSASRDAETGGSALALKSEKTGQRRPRCKRPRRSG